MTKNEEALSDYQNMLCGGMSETTFLNKHEQTIFDALHEAIFHGRDCCSALDRLENYIKSLRLENDELQAKLDKAKDVLEQISRMSPLPDHKSNTMTLVACREIASVALGNKSIVHALRKHKAMNSIYPDAPEQR